MDWKHAKNEIPEEGEYGHSKEFLVWYGKYHNGHRPGFGTAYYSHNPPDECPGWIDRKNYGRQPDYYMEFPEPPVLPKTTESAKLESERNLVFASGCSIEVPTFRPLKQEDIPPLPE